MHFAIKIGIDGCLHVVLSYHKNLVVSSKVLSAGDRVKLYLKLKTSCIHF